MLCYAATSQKFDKTGVIIILYDSSMGKAVEEKIFRLSIKQRVHRKSDE